MLTHLRGVSILYLALLSACFYVLNNIVKEAGKRKHNLSILMLHIYAIIHVTRIRLVI